MPRRPKPFWFRDGWYTEAGGPPRKLLAKGRNNHQAAVAALAALLAEQGRCRDAGRRTTGDVPLSALVEQHLDHVERDLSAGSYRVKRKALRSLLKSFPRKTATQLRPADVRRLLGELSAAGNAPATVNIVLDSLRRLYNWAHKEAGLIGPHNPTRGVKLLPTTGRTRLVTAEEHDRLLRGANPALADVLVRLRHTSVRPGELRGLRWGQIDWEGGVFVLPEHKTRRTATSVQGRPRVIAFPSEVREVLERRRAVQGDAALEHVFLNTRRRPWSDAALGQALAAVRQRAGLEEGKGRQIVLYSSRHNYLTAAARAGASSLQVQLFGGWTSLKMAERYVHLSGKDVAQAAEMTTQAMRAAMRASAT